MKAWGFENKIDEPTTDANPLRALTKQPVSEVIMAESILSSKVCCKCSVVKPLTDFHARGNRRKSYCKTCVSLESAARYRANPEKIKQANRAWRDANPELMNAARANWAKNNADWIKTQNAESYRAAVAAGKETSKWAKENPLKRKEVARRWRQANKAVKNANTAARYAKKLRATTEWADLGEISKFYAEAVTETMKTGRPHHVDHIVPLRSSLVCGLHVESNLQVIEGAANMSKGNKYWPDMP